MSWPSDVTKKDLDVQYMRAGGSGGQNQNKVSSACRITHIPTGIQAESRRHRDQPQNKREAFLKLCARLKPLMLAALVPDLGPVSSDERIRSYDLDADRCIDHRLGKSQVFTAEGVLDGDELVTIQQLVLLSEDPA